MLHAFVIKFNVTENLEKFLVSKNLFVLGTVVFLFLFGRPRSTVSQGHTIRPYSIID